MSNKTKEVKPPKTLLKSMLEEIDNSNTRSQVRNLKRKLFDFHERYNQKKLSEKKLPKNLKKAIKKVVRSRSTQPGKSAFPDPMPTSIRMNKVNRGKIKESLGKSVKTGSDKVIKKAHGGSMCRGMGAATKGGQFRKNG